MRSPERINRSVLKQINLFLKVDDTKSIQSLATIHAVHGLAKNSPYFDMFKSNVNDPTLLIGLTRRLRSEKQFLWETYLNCIKNEQFDAPLITQYMATACATNGWSGRVASHILPRKDPSIRLSNRTVSHLLLAFTHRPSEASDTLKELIGMTRISSAEIFVALIKLYAVNNQWSSLIYLLRIKNRPPIPSSVVESILLSSSQDVNLRFFLLNLTKDEIVTNKMSSIIGLAVDTAIEVKSCRKLVESLELLVPPDPITEAKIQELIDSGEIPPRVRKRLNALLEIIHKKTNSQFIS
jgi:hypothetical protein